MRATALLMGVFLTACDTGGDAEAYKAALPDGRVKIDMPTDGSTDRSSVGDRAEFALFSAQVTRDVNGFIGMVLDTVSEITTYQPTWTDGSAQALWGPWEDNGTTYALWITHDADAGLYSWAIEMDGAAVIAGQADDDASADAYTGWFTVDFDQISAIDGGDAAGAFTSAYEVDGPIVVATAAFEGFSDGGAPINAVYQYTQTVSEQGMLDLIYEADTTGNGEDETNIIRSRWLASGEGRADAYITDGEVGDRVYSATECWDASYAVSFYEDNWSFSRSGEEDACAFLEPSFHDDAD